METRRGVLLRGIVLCWAVVATAFDCGAADSVAEGFPAWEGLDAKNRIFGRTLCPSDMRHKVIVVVEIEPTDEKSTLAQMTAAARFIRIDSNRVLKDNPVPWERRTMPHGAGVVVVNYGGENSPGMITGILRKKYQEVGVDIAMMNFLRTPIYGKGVTFPGAPQAPGGKRPFVYVMGPEGTKPLYSGSLDENGIEAVIKVVGKVSASLPTWRQFYGSIEEVKHFKNLGQVLNSGKTKPLAPVLQEIKKGILSKDHEEAREAQILFDAIEQTRSDFVYRIQMEFFPCPHRALYDMSLHSKYFPWDKKSVEVYADKLKRNPDAHKLCAVLKDVVVWSDPEFECKNKSEAKKIVGRLNAMKKLVEKLKEEKSLPIQNGAHVLDAEIDRLIETIPTKVKSN